MTIIMFAISVIVTCEFQNWTWELSADSLVLNLHLTYRGLFYTAKYCPAWLK